MASRIFEDGLICDVCYEAFNVSDRRPRILSCGHSFCDSCLMMILVRRASSFCPNCKANIHYLKSELIPINFTLESLVSKTNTGTKSKKLQSKGYCEQHGYPKEFRCMDCNTWVCGTCVALHHKQCNIKLVKDYNEVKEKFTETLRQELEAREQIKDSIVESLESLKQEKLDIMEVVRLKENELSICGRRIQDVEAQISSESKICDKLRQLLLLIEDNTKDHDIFSAKVELANLLGQVDDNTENTPLIEHRRKFSGTLESLSIICQNEPVYAIADVDLTLYGKVMVKDNGIWVHSFQSEKPEGTMIPFKKLLTGITGSSEFPKRAFLQVVPEHGDDDEVVDVEIEIDEDSQRGKNFVLLCSALRGRKYKGMTMKARGFFSCRVYTLRPGPTPVVEGIKDSDPKTSYKDGLVYGMSDDDSRFGISLFGGFGSSHVIGVMVSGLQALREHSGCGKNMIIKDSGLIF